MRCLIWCIDGEATVKTILPKVFASCEEVIWTLVVAHEGLPYGRGSWKVYCVCQEALLRNVVEGTETFGVWLMDVCSKPDEHLDGFGAKETESTVKGCEALFVLLED